VRRTVLGVLLAASLAILEPVAVEAFGVGAGASLDTTSISISGTYSGVPVQIREGLLPIGFHAFVDTRYLIGSVGFSITQGGTLAVTVGGSTATGGLVGTLEYVDFALYLKYPLRFGTNEFFPLLGLQYKLNVAYLDAAGTDVTPLLSAQEVADLSELWLKAGVGADFYIRSFYIRPLLTVGFKFLSPTDQGGLAAMQSVGYAGASVFYFTFGLDIHLGWVIVNERLSSVR